MADTEHNVNVDAAYTCWPGTDHTAGWLSAPGWLDVILVYDDDGQMVGQFERYRYTAPDGRLKWGRPL